MSSATNQPPRSAWPHCAAWALACATFPLIWVGGLVTTYDAGMSVPDWPSTYGYNMFLYPLSTWVSGPWDLFIEHGHRLLGSLVGLLTIGLNLAIWRFDARRWLRYVGFAALALVILQGVMGGLRVRLDSNLLARLHGCVGPLFFSLSVAICVFTSPYWRGAGGRSAVKAGQVGVGLVAAAWFTFAVAYFQLVLGAHLRHPGVAWAPHQFRAVVVLHVVTAFVLLAQVGRVALAARRLPRPLGWPALLLGGLVVCQLLLGVAAWRAKYGWPEFLPVPFASSMTNFTVQAESMSQALTVTAHVAVGSLILGASVLYATRVSRFAYLSSRSLVGGRVEAGSESAGTPTRSVAAAQGAWA